MVLATLRLLGRCLVDPECALQVLVRHDVPKLDRVVTSSLYWLIATH
jgi:hypothetical protein